MFALAGGAHGVAYPAQTLYSHLGSRGFYDVTEGGNGMCGGRYSAGCTGSMMPLSPFDCGEGVLICNAAPGYDGPSGLGTPNGLSAFRPGGGEEESEAEERPAESHSTGTSPTSTPSGVGATSQPVGNDSTQRDPVAIRLSDFDLTFAAINALNHGWPAVTRVAFAFTLSASTVVRAGLSKLVRRDGHRRWQVLADALTIAGRRGRNHARLRAPGRLAPGLYRLRLRPVGGSFRSLLITVGP
jgi:hypothetical protein